MSARCRLWGHDLVRANLGVTPRSFPQAKCRRCGKEFVGLEIVGHRLDGRVVDFWYMQGWLESVARDTPSIVAPKPPKEKLP